MNQGKIRRATDDRAQVFAVDEWRLRQIADKLYDIDEEREKAYLSMLVYTIATSATLTPGDLPVFVVSKKTETVASD